MRLRKLRFLFVALLAASSLLFAGGEVRAATFSYVPNFDGMSEITPASAKYTYTFIQTPGSSALSYIDFEIPIGISLIPGPFSGGSNANLQVTLNNTDLSGEVYDTAIGDFGTKFGVGDARYRVVKINIPSSSSKFTIVLQIKGQTPGIIFAASSGMVLIKAGNGSNTQSFMLESPAVGTSPLPNPPVISSFSASPNPVLSGQCVTLSWSVTGATSAVINNITVDPAAGSYEYCPAVTSYTITFSNATGGSASATTNVTVNSPPPKPSNAQISTNLAAVTPPECATLTWSSTGATSAVIDPIGSVLPSGSAMVCPDNTTTFTFTATNLSGSTSADVTVSVNQPLIQTTCKQIRKNSKSGHSTCINLCLKTIDGVKQDIDSADWYDSPDCSTGGPVPLEYSE